MRISDLCRLGILWCLWIQHATAHTVPDMIAECKCLGESAQGVAEGAVGRDLCGHVAAAEDHAADPRGA